MMLGLSHQRLSNASSTTSTFSRRPLQARSSPTELCSSRSPHPRQSRPCCASPQDSETSDRQQQQPSSSSDSSLSAAPSKQTNALIAGGAALIGVGLFAYTRLSVGPATLATLQQVSLPYEEALTNGKPTLLEFYADWCEICRSTAPDVYQVEQQQADKLNFVMLNVDNNAWTGEKREYRVSGIPHFVFLDDRGQARGAAIGKIPKQFLADNVARLVSGTRLQGFSKNAPPSQASPERAAAQQAIGPRTHG